MMQILLFYCTSQLFQGKCLLEVLFRERPEKTGSFICSEESQIDGIPCWEENETQGKKTNTPRLLCHKQHWLPEIYPFNQARQNHCSFSQHKISFTVKNNPSTLLKQQLFFPVNLTAKIISTVITVQETSYTLPSYTIDG